VLAHIELAESQPASAVHVAALGLEHPEHRLVLMNLSDQLKRGYTILKHEEDDRSLADKDGMRPPRRCRT